METVRGCPLLASSRGRLWDTSSKRYPNFSRGFCLERPCREAGKADVRGITALLETPDEDAGPLGAWCKDAREQLGWFCSPVSQPKTPPRRTKPHAASMRACKACGCKLARHAFILFAHPLLPPHLPAMQFPAKQGSCQQNPPETSSACNILPVGGKPDLKFPSHLH